MNREGGLFQSFILFATARRNGIRIKDPGPDRHPPECPGKTAGGGAGRTPGGCSPGAHLYERPEPGARYGGADRRTAAAVRSRLLRDAGTPRMRLWPVGGTDPAGRAAGRFPDDWNDWQKRGGAADRPAEKISLPSPAGRAASSSGGPGRGKRFSFPPIADRSGRSSVMPWGSIRPSGTASPSRTVRSRRWSVGRRAGRSSCS